MSRNVMGSFRGATFIVEDDDRTLGRRNIVHEYPLRKKPYVEDNGGKKHEHTITVSTRGATWDTDRDFLADAIDQQGPGTLVHPDFGTITVSITDAHQRQSSREYGKATFVITFIEGDTDPRYPTSAADTAAAVKSAATKSLASSINDFANVFSVVGLASAYVDGLVSDLTNVLGSIENVVGSVTGPIADLIRAPYDMASLISGSITKISSLVSEPGQALNLYSGLFTAGDSSQPVPTNTTERQQQARSQQALHDMIRRSAIVQSANTTAGMTFDTADDATTATDNIIAAIDAQLESVDVVDGMPIDDDVYFSLSDLRTALLTDLRTRTAKLPKLRAYTPNATLPALAIAYQLYGDATRESELVMRNRIAHPGFVQGGQELEVLDG